MGLVIFDRGPLRHIAEAVEPGQDHRAPIKGSDHRDQLGHRRDPAGEPGGDDRVAGRRSAPDRRLLRQQAVAPIGRIERAFGSENAGPGPRQDFEKGAHDLPMLGQIGRREVGEPRKARSLGRNGVEKPREAGGECGGLARQERVADCAVCPTPAPAGSTAAGGAVPGSPAAPPWCCRRPPRPRPRTARPNRGRRSAASAAATTACPGPARRAGRAEKPRAERALRAGSAAKR